MSKYDVSTESETIHIFPKNARGETMRVALHRQYITLKRELPVVRMVGSDMATKSPERTGAMQTRLVVFKRYSHRGNWYWKDGRTNKAVPSHFVRDELAAMLYNGDSSKAEQLMAEVSRM